MYDPPIQRHKTIVMQRIQQAASRGYNLYTYGSVPYKKAPALADKFAEKYGIHLNENQRGYRKRLKRSNAFLYLYPKKDSDLMLWWLLATEGEGTVHTEEVLKSIYNKHERLTWDGDYELVVMPKDDSKPTVTWRMTRGCYKDWNDRIRKSIRQKYTDDKARQAVWSLGRAPGFSGVRSQVKRLHAVFRAEWKRTRRQTDTMPSIASIGYVRGLKSDTVALSVLVKRMNQGKRPFPRKITTTTTGGDDVGLD